MVNRYWSYDMLKQLVIQTFATINLEEIKHLFAYEIDSVRRRDCIQSMEDLITCLEEFDELSEFNIEAFQKLANTYKSSFLQQSIQEYLTFMKPPPPLTNIYQEIRLAEEVRAPFQNSSSIRVQSSSYGNAHPTQSSATVYSTVLDERQRKAISKKLADDLGTDWRIFGRELDISEGDMDDIELQFPRDLKSRVYRLLTLFEEDDCHDPKKYVTILCEALDSCRRKDIRRKIMAILSH